MDEAAQQAMLGVISSSNMQCEIFPEVRSRQEVAVRNVLGNFCMCYMLSTSLPSVIDRISGVHD